MATSVKTAVCFAGAFRNWRESWRHLQPNLVESLDADADNIENLAQSLRDGATLADGFKAIAHLPQFKTLKKPKKPAPTGDTP